MEDAFVPLVSRLHAHFALEQDRLYLRCYNMTENKIQWTSSVKKKPTKMEPKAIDHLIELCLKGERGTFEQVWTDAKGRPPNCLPPIRATVMSF